MMKPLAFKAFDSDDINEVYSRGDYLIVLGKAELETYLFNDSLGGDFIKFKKSQGFNVIIISYDELGLSQAEDLRDYIHNTYSNGMLEYVLLVGDVNGTYGIPPFAILSYNEQETDVTDYPYTFIDLDQNDNIEEWKDPEFIIGRWPIRDIAELLTMKAKSIQYITNSKLIDSGDDLSFYNDAMLVAGNYKTADGVEVPPNEWPVTPVWTSLWLYDELKDYGYAQIDTAFFHQNNYQTATNNPVIKSSWDEGLGVINYRGWGDATGWHRPSFHLQEATSLSNQWRLPVVMSFVCNTGDFGNDYYDPAGYNKCFGELLVTSGSLITPKGAVAMVGPSDLDTDTRFNNVMCGVMWDGLLTGNTPEIGPALHYGKQALINEFNGLEIEGADMGYDFFYHHVYTVLGDPSLPVILESPKTMTINIENSDNIDIYGHNTATDPLSYSYIDCYVYDENGDPLEDVVGALMFDDNNGSEVMYKGLSNENGLLIIDFDLSNQSTLDLYLNKPQYLQRKISINYLGDEENDAPQVIPVELIIELNTDLFAVSNQDYDLSVTIYNPSNYNIESFDLSGISFWYDSPDIGGDDVIANYIFTPPSGHLGFGGGSLSLQPGESIVYENTILMPSLVVGDVLNIDFQFNDNLYAISSNSIEVISSSNVDSYLTSDPSPKCNYGYQAFDHTDIQYDSAPVYDWVELNSIDGAENLGLLDDTITKKTLPFDFKYFGKTYNEGQLLTICSNGWISLEETNIDHFWNFSIPNPMGPSAMIAPFMDDLDDNNGTEVFNVWYFEDQVNNRLIIEWDNVSNGQDDEFCPSCIKESFQVILHDPNYYNTKTGDGEIIFQYKSIYDIDDNGVFSTIGIESPDQGDGIEYLYNQQAGLGSFWVKNEENGQVNLNSEIAIKFTTGLSDISCALYDINQDGIVNVQDIVAAINYVLGAIIPTSEQLCAADTNSDGIVNVQDIVAIVGAALGS